MDGHVGKGCVFFRGVIGLSCVMSVLSCVGDGVGCCAGAAHSSEVGVE